MDIYILHQELEGLELCLPQLGIKIPIIPGQILTILTGMMVHFSVPGEGFRVVFTCFSDKFLMKHSDEEI